MSWNNVRQEDLLSLELYVPAMASYGSHLLEKAEALKLEVDEMYNDATVTMDAHIYMGIQDGIKELTVEGLSLLRGGLFFIQSAFRLVRDLTEGEGKNTSKCAKRDYHLRLVKNRLYEANLVYEHKAEYYRAWYTDL